VNGDVTLNAPGHDRWLPLPLEGDADVAAAAVIDGLVDADATPAFRDETVAMVADLSRLVRRQAERRGPTGELTYAAWMLMPAPYLLLPGPVAVLLLRPLSAADTDDEIIAAATDLSVERHGPVDVDVLDSTPAGRALSVRYRPLVEGPGGPVVNEHRVVLWPHREYGMTLELHLYVSDLVEGGHAAEPLLELARGIRWNVE